MTALSDRLPAPSLLPNLGESRGQAAERGDRLGLAFTCPGDKREGLAGSGSFPGWHAGGRMERGAEGAAGEMVRQGSVL